ncbi:MAG: TonB-dependent receptor [Pseudomonadales bacterium]
MTSIKHRLITALFLGSGALSAPFSSAEESLSEIIVSAEFRGESALALPLSVSVIDDSIIERRTARHLEELLHIAPNVNFASGASRGRFIQIRGIGERSEFQDPINSSVGVLLDGIDITGISTVASTLDIAQIEILRGPQGSLHGANALAGLINIVSNNPTDEFYASIASSIEEYGGLSASGVVSGPISESTGYRFAAQHFRSDGFNEDVFLGRDDTNNIDETSARLRISSTLNERLSADWTLFYADVQNGYDTFSLDNTRVTYSDEPGVDEQETLASSLKINFELNDNVNLETLLSLASSELRYRYDEDWSHLGICDNTACDSSLFGFDWFYSSVDDYQRDNDNVSLDLRLLGNNWVAGVYHRDQSIDLLRLYTFNAGPFSSTLNTQNTAAYAQTNVTLSDRVALTIGARLEQRSVDYTDSAAGSESPDEFLWGGKLALEYTADSGAFYYALISRGYKAGGFNLDQAVPVEQREFDTETMLNYELGVKQQYLDGALNLQLAVFYQDRNDIQSKQSIVRSIATGVVGGICPCDFTDFTGNAAQGTNTGLEMEINWQATEQLQLWLNVGVLDTEFGDFETCEHVLADCENGLSFNLDGRAQAHAPEYQANLGGQYNFGDHWYVIGSVDVKDEFYFSERHNVRSDSYELFNLEAGFRGESWTVAAYGKNLSDELVQTRGFGAFGNDPRKFYELEPYNQFAAPRVLGVKASMEF